MDVGVDQISQLLPDVPLSRIYTVLEERNGDVQSALDYLLGPSSDGENKTVSDPFTKSSQTPIHTDEKDIMQLCEMFEHIPVGVLQMVYHNHRELESALDYLVNCDTEDIERLKIVVEGEATMKQHPLRQFARTVLTTTNVWEKRTETVNFLVELLGSSPKQVSRVVAKEHGSLDLSLRQLLLAGGSTSSGSTYSNTLAIVELYRQFHSELYLIDDTMLRLLSQRLAPEVVKIVIALHAIVDEMDQIDTPTSTEFSAAPPSSFNMGQKVATEEKNAASLHYAKAAHQSFSGATDANATTKLLNQNIDRIALQRHCAALAGRVSTTKDSHVRDHYSSEYRDAKKQLRLHRDQLQQQLVAQRTQVVSQTLDLHGLTVPMAKKATLSALKRWWSEEILLREWDGVRYKHTGPVQHMEPLRLITGRGMHSSGGFSQIRKCLIKELEASWILNRDNPGELIVLGRRKKVVANK
ncbi:BA75_04458T0 [Komagataella pastoris]|uniref:BA75_04458T0 n=1 Tax=Komagataella pastoris TaxID=4922 RepID=A0A1B2JIB9_PICPA|nr:BA75_04458T0 [Komagataella pastoris]